MRKLILAALLFATGGLGQPALAQAELPQLNVLAPGVVYNAGLLDLAAAYTKETGVKVTVKAAGMAAIVNQIKTGTPPTDVMALPVAFMDGMEAEDAVLPGTRADLGRVHVGVAVKKGAPHPDISTVAKLAAVLKQNGPINVSNPASGSMVARLLNDMLRRHPEFAGVKTKIAVGREGGEALVAGEGTMALQLICEIVNHPEIELVGKLPAELAAYIDTSLAVSKRSPDPARAKAFVDYLMRADHRALWAAKGLERLP